MRATDGRLLGRPSVEDFESPYLLSGLARCAPCGAALVGLKRAHGRGRRPLYGCAYHHKRGAAVCANDVEIRQERLETEVVTQTLGCLLKDRADLQTVTASEVSTLVAHAREGA